MSNCKHFPNADDHCLVCEEADRRVAEFTEAQQATLRLVILLAETGAADLRHDHPLGVRHAIERFDSIKNLLESL